MTDIIHDDNQMTQSWANTSEWVCRNVISAVQAGITTTTFLSLNISYNWPLFQSRLFVYHKNVVKWLVFHLVSST